MLKDKITLNVLANIERRIGGTTIISAAEETRFQDNNRALVVFNGSNIDLGDKLFEIKQLKDRGLGLSIAFSFMGDQIIEEDKIISYLKPDKVYKEEHIMELKTIAKRYAYIIAPTLTISTMSKVAGGFIDNFIANVIWTFLYMGKPVYIDFTSTKNYLGEPCNNKMIEKLIDEKINSIKELGAKEINTGNYESIIGEKNLFKNKENLSLNTLSKTNIYSPLDWGDKKIILTERDIGEICRDNRSISLEKGTILTPLAKDKIKSMGIAVNYL